MSAFFEALFESQCPVCWGRISVGDRIAPNVHGEALSELWVHEVCPGSRPVAAPLREICDVCFTEKALSGACMCTGLS